MSNNGRKRPAPASGRAPKIRKPRKPVSDDEESNDSLGSEPTQEKPRTPSPIIDDPTKKLPEELLQAFYKPPGRLLIAGCVAWDMVAKRDTNIKNRSHPNLYTFHKFTENRFRLAVSGCSAGHSILISESGEAYAFGRNNCGQLGFGDTNTRNTPEPIPALEGKNIIHAAVGRHHTLFITDTGAVFACGDNKSGQCGLGNTTPQILKPTRVRYTSLTWLSDCHPVITTGTNGFAYIAKHGLPHDVFLPTYEHRGAPIVKGACGTEFSMILDCNGALHSFGLPEYGQLGHNTDGKFFVSSTKLSYHFETIPKLIAMFFEKTKDGHILPVKDVVIVDISCGNNHSVAIDTKKRAFSWGFGGFGRLGHAEPRDESVPRLIKYFETAGRGVRSVYCGATYSLAINELGSLFLFGQTKRTGEANMYPKPVQDLQGWTIKSVGTSNTSVVVAADDSLVAWGTAPTYGELGTGEINKSSARPREVSRMDGLSVTCVTMGYSHTLLISDDSTDAVKQKLANIPVFEP